MKPLPGIENDFIFYIITLPVTSPWQSNLLYLSKKVKKYANKNVSTKYKGKHSL